jgi:hypothetical protein
VIEEHFRDVHRDPIFFRGYSMRVAEGGYLPRRLWKDPAIPEFDLKRRVRVRISNDAYAELKADLIERASSGRWNAANLEAAIWNVPYLPYAPIREQLRDLVRWMNRARRERGFGDLVRLSSIQRKIPAVRAFSPTKVADSEASNTFDLTALRSNGQPSFQSVEYIEQPDL